MRAQRANGILVTAQAKSFLGKGLRAVYQSKHDFKVKLDYSFKFFEDSKTFKNTIVFNSKEEAIKWVENCLRNRHKVGFSIINYTISYT